LLDLLPHSTVADVDQASGLRRLFAAPRGQAIAFVAGRENTGRAGLLIKTATALAGAGQRVVLIDERGGHAGIHAMLGVKARCDMRDAVRNDLAVEAFVQPVAPLLSVISAQQLAAQAAQPSPLMAQKLALLVRQLQENSAFVLLDCAPLQGHPVSVLAAMMPHWVVLAAAQEAAITRAYASIKQLSQAAGREDFHVAITRTRTEQEAQVIFRNMQKTAQAHLHVHLNYLGSTRVATRPGRPASPLAEDHLAPALQRGLVGPGQAGHPPSSAFA
jgi:flagellar biosynthesis protein FlhG